MAAEATRAAMVDDSQTLGEAGSPAPPTSTLDTDDVAAATPALDGPPGRYELLEEIDRGGMGAIVRAHDRTLGREVAVKVLQERFAAGSAIARRFVDEARIAGQLQHPGIPPVHDLGTLPDGRPFLAMKLIKGRTLDAMLRDRPDAAADRGRFLAAFEQACQAVAYAHSRHVIHRDLKPANVMVGAFGEVQVMDWGLAKVLADRSAPAPPPDGDAEQRLATEIRSARDTEGSETQAGSVLGTPAYMPPEQAIGAVEQVDARSDVFGLGAILAVILTGRPPYVGGDAESIRMLAARGKLAECFALLDVSGAESDLVALCKRCLSPERDDRPADARGVAAAVAGLRAAAEERARQAELDRVRAEAERAQAEAEARAQRQKRRTQLAIAAGVLGLVVVGGGGWLAVRGQAQARRADADRVASVALGRAEQLVSQAVAIDAGEVAPAIESGRLWEQAEAAIRQAEEALAGAGDAALSARVKDRAASVRSGLARARRDAALLATLEAARGAYEGTAGKYTDRRGAVRLYRAALAAAGLPALAEPEKLAAAVRAEPPGLRTALIRALDNWAIALQFPLDPDAERVRNAVGLLDTDPFRQKIRAAVATRERAALARLAETPGLGALPPETADLLMRSLFGFHHYDQETNAKLVPILRKLRERRPSDLAVLTNLSQALSESSSDPARIEEATGCDWAAVAAHPESALAHYCLGVRLKYDPDAAEPHYLKALELNPRFTFAMINLGAIRERNGDLAGAERWFRKAAETDPQFPKPHINLGGLLERRGDLSGAEAKYRKALELDPGNEQAGTWLARVQRRAALLPRLDDILSGRDAPASPVEALRVAEICTEPSRRQYAAAARFYQRAFAGDPKLADDPTAAHRYDAACYAAKAGCGQGTNAPADPTGRSQLRKQALDWLRADLAKTVEQAVARPVSRRTTAEWLSSWLEDPDLAGLRPGPGRIDLPADERSAWDAFWADVRATLERARKTPAATPPAPMPATAPAPGG
jgi:serine/threonine protein kinase